MREDPFAREVITKTLYASGYESEIEKRASSVQEMNAGNQSLFQLLYNNLKQLEKRDFSKKESGKGGKN